MATEITSISNTKYPQSYTGLRVHAAISDDSGCGHYRAINPLTYLNMMGAECKWSSAGTLSDFKQSDIIIFQRSTDLSTLYEVQQSLKGMGRLIIYETDDNHHCIDPGSSAYGVYHQGSQELRGVEKMMGGSHGMTVSTQEIGGVYSHIQPNVRCVPNSIDFDLRDWTSPVEEKDPNFLYLAWSGGSTHKPDLQDMGPVIREILRKYDYVKIALYSGLPTIQQTMDGWGITEDRVQKVPAVPFKDYPKGLGWFDIGFGPLRQMKFNAAKSNLRFLEWSAKKIPGVYSVSLPYSMSIRNGVNGFTAGKSPQDWIEKLSYLIEHKEERAKMAEVAYNIVKEEYDQANVAHQWVKAWKSIAETARGEYNPPVYKSLYGQVGRNDKCPCGSGLKYKSCVDCYGAFG